MSNKTLNKIERETLLDVIRDAGLEVEEMAAFFKCSDGPGPARIYVAKTKKVSRVHLAGFTLNRPGVTQITANEAKDLRMGTVRGELDFSQSNELVLEALTKSCNAVKAVNKMNVAAGPVTVGPDVPTEDKIEVVEREEIVATEIHDGWATL